MSRDSDRPPARPVPWYAAAVFLGIFGGLAGAYLIGLPITVGLAFLLVGLSRRHGTAPATLRCYAAGVGAVPVFVILSESDHGPTKGALIASAILAGLAITMAAAASTTAVRGRGR